MGAKEQACLCARKRRRRWGNYAGALGKCANQSRLTWLLAAIVGRQLRQLRLPWGKPTGKVKCVQKKKPTKRAVIESIEIQIYENIKLFNGIHYIY